MAKFKPIVYVDDKLITYPTYQELKSDLKELIEKSSNKIVQVYRSKHGQFGEYFEHWKLNYERKPFIIKQGWM